ncbi:neutral zinc metallopeptidase [Chryseolinea sp. H1M3-3]|uniref:KPN_02809 family neutral zinc metallopeptidase n=1 Tax=Chryseolinea sp. H1M3-3 TaxID=3034144 RepID=UPI0023EAFAA7|nr:neutral zinc metallopeptidase [Chryseolinea sp. H1M3-3]
MRWIGRQGSGNVEDRRGMGGGGKIAIGGGAGLIIVIISLLLGQNPLDYLNADGGSSAYEQQQQVPRPEEENQQAQFVRVVLKDTEDVWNALFQQRGEAYQEPVLVLFTGSGQSGCGMASAAMGPFYCPLDSKVYIDLSFYDDLQSRFGAPGDFAMAYVVAHEVGHHVQHLWGITDKVHGMRDRLNEEENNKMSVKLELQADFLAGVWAHHNQKLNNILEPGDIEEALNAANAIGDDRLQKQSQGYVVPDAFTHGTSEQRMFWFKKGFETGDIEQGDTFREDL